MLLKVSFNCLFKFMFNEITLSLIQSIIQRFQERNLLNLWFTSTLLNFGLEKTSISIDVLRYDFLNIIDI